MPAKNKNLLLVEGKVEQYSIPELMDYHTVWGDKPKDWVVEIKQMEGIGEILKDGVITAEAKTPGLKALGVIIDADDSFGVRWNRLKKLLGDIEKPEPSDLPANGLIHVTSKGLRVGVWIMPDNSSRGMLETFLARLLSPDCAPIWDLARTTCDQVRTLKFAHVEGHRDKAQIHTYLAWIDPPGQTLPQAIITRAIDARHELALSFAAWMMSLFQLQPRPAA